MIKIKAILVTIFSLISIQIVKHLETLGTVIELIFTFIIGILTIIYYMYKIKKK